MELTLSLSIPLLCIMVLLGVLASLLIRLIKLEAQLLRAEDDARKDALTGLPNRRYLSIVGPTMLAQAKRLGCFVGVMFIDLDGFKAVNDTAGHEAGDQILLEVARRFRLCTREVDVVVRLGGDEFVIIVPNLDMPVSIERVANRILQQFRQPIPVAAGAFAVTASIGAAFYPSHSHDLDELIKWADRAMYRAKNAGKNQLAY